MLIFNNILKWKFLLSRQVKQLCDFNGQRACDRRLLKLTNDGYLNREKVLYGYPFLYYVSLKAYREFSLLYKPNKVRLGEIEHDILVVDTAIYLIKKQLINQNTIVSERELKNKAGYGVREHYPDFVYVDNKQKSHCVELELSLKSYNKLYENVSKNYSNYDCQDWYVFNAKTKIIQNLLKCKQDFNNLNIFDVSEVQGYVKNL